MSKYHGSGFSGHETATQVTETQVIYHRTVVAELLPDGGIRLNSGGWRTRTTARRMDQAVQHFRNERYAHAVYQKDFQWFVSDGREFFDGIEV
jgi:hypothetical protein